MKVKFFSLGCKVNSYENNALKATLLCEGYEITNEDNPDVVILNTCSVTSTADQKSRQHIRKFKNNYPNAIIVVMGCYVQGNVDFVKEELNADIIVGTSNRDKIPSLIKEFKQNKQQIVFVDTDPREFKYEELGIASFSENVRAYLKIQDGCDNFCSYCLIPLRRGKSRSRNKDDILKEAKSLVKKGYKEIVLTGIHVGGYGQDISDYSFSDLVEDLLKIKGLFRLRISSIEASEIDNKLIWLMLTKPNLAKHLHIPIQSGSSTVLKRMNRKYDAEQFIEKVNQIRYLMPDICLTTDVIVGFPGESDKEFNETVLSLVRCGFNMLHVFPFSPREGTVAYDMKEQIDPKIKDKRVKRLLDLSKKLWEQYTDRFVGKEVTVLIEEFDPEKKIIKGHTSNYLEVSLRTDIGLVGQNVKTEYKKV